MKTRRLLFHVTEEEDARLIAKAKSEGFGQREISLYAYHKLLGRYCSCGANIGQLYKFCASCGKPVEKEA